MSSVLESAAVEVETHVRQSGWGQRPAVFALVRASRFAEDEPETAALLGVAASSGDLLTPIEQESLPEGELDESLARIGWPDSVAGCALVQEIVILPPSAEHGLDDAAALAAATDHPQRREARLAVAVLRDGSSAALLRLRGAHGVEDTDLLTGPDLAPNLARALLATLSAD